MSSGHGAGGISTGGGKRRARLRGARDALVVAVLGVACTGLTEPPVPPAALHLPDGPARLVGGPPSSCSNPQSNGDRWCAFAVESTAALWVVRLAHDAAPRCDAIGPDCLRLTAHLWTGHPPAGPIHPYSHRFDGDTLIFHADAASGPDAVYRGPVYAWRPGWSVGRPIADGVAVLCTGHPRLPLVDCLEDGAGSLRVSAGQLVDRDDLRLTPLGPFPRSRIGADADGDMDVPWQAGFSPDGAFFVFSTPEGGRPVETLRLVATADLGRVAPREIIRDATFWDFSADGARLYFLRRGGGEIFEADFPSGDRVHRLTGGAVDVRVFGADAE
jgi:hypothetical protein